MARFVVEGDGAKLSAAVEHAIAEALQFEQSVGEAESGVRAARAAEADSRATHDEARRKADRIRANSSDNPKGLTM